MEDVEKDVLLDTQQQMANLAISATRKPDHRSRQPRISGARPSRQKRRCIAEIDDLGELWPTLATGLEPR